MAEAQGGADVFVRDRRLVFVAMSEVMGRLENGVWRGFAVTDWEAFTASALTTDQSESLGAMLRRCLEKSRLVSREWGEARLHEPAPERGKRLAAAFGLASRTRLYDGMKCAAVEWARDAVEFVPTRRRRGDFFTFARGEEGGHEAITLAFRATDESLGEALRETLNRCL